jgi:transcriptional regulator with XRE-family HTH domain
MADLLHFMAMGDFPNRVNQLRRERGLTQQQLADAVGCSKMQVSGIERGKREFSYSMMQRFAAALGVSVADLLGQKDNPYLLAPDERDMITRMRYASPDEREQLQRVAEAMLPFRDQRQDAA